MIKDIYTQLKNNISKMRYSHTLGVVKAAKILAEKYGADIDKTEVAALLHDCGKLDDYDLLLKRIGEFDIILDDIMKKSPDLAHGYVGAKIAQLEYHIKDEEILDAIRYHTTGREDMSLLEKIIYVADYIEENRIFKGVEIARQLAYEDIDKALLYAMDHTIKYVIERGYMLHIDTIKGRNYIISSII